MADRFVDALLFRRYGAKLAFELGFWGRFGEDGGTPGGYSELLTAATGIRYPAENYLGRHGLRLLLRRLPAGLDPLRPAALVPRRRGGRGLVAERAATGARLRDLFREGTRPTSEEIAARIGFEPLDTGPLLQGLAG